MKCHEMVLRDGPLIDLVLDGLLTCFLRDFLIISIVSMVTDDPLAELTEELSLLLEEMGITSGLLFESLVDPMTALRSGRSPQAIELEEKLVQPQQYFLVLQEVLPEFDGAIAQLRQKTKGLEGGSELLGEISNLEKEAAFYRQFQETAETLLKKLSLIAEEGRLSNLGKLPIEDAWEEMEQMAHHI